jgi:SAM-dependent methyltransferase
MDPAAYGEFRDLERSHWWFRGRTAIFEAIVARRVLPEVRERPIRALDVGCGMGAHLGILGPEGRSFGTDLELGAIRHCRDRGFQAVALADGTRLPFQDAAFDLVTALDTLEHIPDDAAAARECARVLKPGGILVVSGPAYQFLYTHQDRVVEHRRRYTLGAVRSLLEGAGLELLHGTYVNWILFPGILAAIVLIKIKQRLRPPQPGDQRSNASIRFPRWLNGVLAWIFSAERHVAPFVRLPFGHSLVAIARRPVGAGGASP